MVVIIIVAALVVAGAVVGIVLSKSKKPDAVEPAAPRLATPPASAPKPTPAAPATEPSTSAAPAPGAPASPPAAAATPPAAAAPRPSFTNEPLVAALPPKKLAEQVAEAKAAAKAAEEKAASDEPDLSRFASGPAARAAGPKPGAAPSSAASDPVDSFAAAASRPVIDDAPDATPPVDLAPVDAGPPPDFDLGRVVIAPLFGRADERADDEDAVGPGATVTRLEPRADADDDRPLAAIVADLIDAADPEVAEVMARLIDASDPDLVSSLVEANDLEVAEVVAKLVDAADPDVRSLVAELADAPDRRQVAEVLRIVDASYSGDENAALPADIAEKLEELDIEADLELTSRPAEMAQFARLDNKDQLRVIIRVLCGLVAREDLPRSPRMPADPASAAENRRWPLSRARWPVPPPDDEDIVKRAPLPARRTSSVAS
jgi:hypothetical protein